MGGLEFDFWFFIFDILKYNNGEKIFLVIIIILKLMGMIDYL